MIGEKYFDLRSRLGTDLYALASLVREMGGSPEDGQILDNLIASLNDPFVFVVVGEVNVGKSTFLNALFGADITTTGVMPTTDKICVFKYGHTIHSTPIATTIDEIRVPCEFLKDFHIVDTPGTNSIENEHQQITERFVPVADLVIFVFSAMNPWGASAWQFLDKVHSHWGKNVIFVLQQADLRSTEEVRVISDYMLQLCRQRFGREFPIFPVSGKSAFFARTERVVPDGLLETSGFPPLESHITCVVMQSPARKAKLHYALKLSSKMLDQLLSTTRSELSVLTRRRQLIGELESERTLQIERTKAKFDGALDATDRDYHTAADHILATMEVAFTVSKAFTTGNPDTRVPNNLDHRLYQDLLANSAPRWKGVALVLDADHRRFDEHVTQQWNGELYLAAAPAVADPADPEHAHRRFQAKIDSALRRFVISLKMNEVLEPAAIESRILAKQVPLLAISGVVISGVISYTVGLLPGAIAATASALLLGLWLLRISGHLSAALCLLEEQFNSARTVLRDTLRDQMAEETQNAYSDFDSRLTQEMDETQQKEDLLREREKQLSALETSLAATEQSLN
jgi:small GTP-binding protein